MRHRSHWRLAAGIGVIAGTLVLSAPGFTAPAPAAVTSRMAVSARAATPSQSGPVSATPAAGTPSLPATSTPQETIHQLKQCGSDMYAVGTFTTIKQGGVDYTRHNIFSFDATAPYTITSWAPDVNGNIQAIAFDGGNCSQAYIGGTFTSVNGTTVRNFAAISTTTGDVNRSFGHSANGEVDTLAVHDSDLLVGGEFTKIDNSSADPYYASLSVSTGQNNGYLDLHISGNYEYSGAANNPTRVYNQQVSPGNERVMVEGDFTSVGGQPRQQIFQMWFGPKNGEVTGWNAPVFNTHCYTGEPFYTYSAAWAPSEVVIYVATTGNHVYDWNNQYPLPLPCDAAMAFSADESTQNPMWSNQTGCDSLFSVAADSYAVYFSGHERWSENPDGCNHAGPGAIKDYGMEGLSPSTGKLLLNSQGAPLYSMSRANGFNMNLGSAGMWIASTNRYGSDECQGVPGHAGICFLPYPSS